MKKHFFSKDKPKKQANNFADYLLENNLKTTEIKEKKLKKQVYYVQFAMSVDYHTQNQHKYGEYVRFDYQLEEALVFAIVKTKSFNSYTLAYGLMQIVPTDVGKDVYKTLNNKDRIPTKEKLFTPKTNIQYGTTYSNILFTRYLTGIANSLSHEYCVIAVYNAGSGNALNVFDKNCTKVVQKINSTTSTEVYRKLRTSLYPKEVRSCLHTVMNSKKKFQTSGTLDGGLKNAQSDNINKVIQNIATLETMQKRVVSF